MSTVDRTTPAGAPVPAGPAPDRLDRVLLALHEVRRPDHGLPTCNLLADVALVAVEPELAALVRVRERLTELADSLDADGDSYLAWSLDHHQRGDQVTARISRVRFEESRRHAAQLRHLLEAL